MCPKLPTGADAGLVFTQHPLGPPDSSPAMELNLSLLSRPPMVLLMLVRPVNWNYLGRNADDHSHCVASLTSPAFTGFWWM